MNSKGYHIVSGYYPLPSYVLAKDKLQGPLYDKIWRVQNVDAKKYLSKTIESYGFIIKNHPLEKRYSRVSALVMVCENKVIGGYSNSYQPGTRGVSPYYSIDGKTAEELTDSEYSQWEQVWKLSIQKDTNFEKAYRYLKGKGYNIVSSAGPLIKYVFTKEKLLNKSHMQIWSVQSVDVKKYLDKTIEMYGFIVKNHPLDKNARVTVVVFIYENKVIGGYSYPEGKRLQEGWVYSIDGKTLQEITGFNYQEWEQQWIEKYK